MTSVSKSGRATRRATLGDLVGGAVLTGAVAAATWWVVGPPATSFGRAVALLYGSLATLILLAPPPRRGGAVHGGIGPASRVTLARSALVVPIGALLVAPGRLGTAGLWCVVALGTLAMLLDGVDGWVARRTGSASEWGGRFDMETDAFLMLALSALVLTEGRAGPWVLLIGAMRYIFVTAGFALPALRAPLFPSLRRKVVCVVQGVALLVCLGPIIPLAVTPWVAAVALAALGWSFGVDTVWLLRAGDAPPVEPA